jgi:hypothetical protein
MAASVVMPAEGPESIPHLARTHLDGSGFTCSSAADCVEDPDLGAVGYWSRQPAGETDVLLADEDIDVLADLTLLRSDTISKAGAQDPERFERVANRGRSASDLDELAAAGERSQCRSDVKRDGH